MTPNLTPVDAFGRLDADRLRNYLEWLIDRGVDGIYVNGSTGEFNRLSEAVQYDAVRTAATVAANRVPVVAGVVAGVVGDVSAVRTCLRRYAELAVRAAAVLPPTYLPVSPAGVGDYLDALLTDAPVDVVLYNIPQFASAITPDVLAELVGRHRRVIGMKDSSGDVAGLGRLIDAARDRRETFITLNGWDPVMTAAAAIGCDGGTNATSGVIPEVTRALHRSCVGGRFADARRLQRSITGVFDACGAVDDFPRGYRLAVKYRGIDIGDGPLPTRREPPASQIEAIHRAVDAALDDPLVRDPASAS